MQLPVLLSDRDTTVTATAVSLDQFIHSPLWRPVTNRILVDRTGLTGRYDFTFKWSSESSPSALDTATSNAPSLFTALQEQLGLKLVPTTAPIEVLVIDHIEKPSEN
jgi:bla regulator protein BlaR1